ncbi:MAG: hypothetical protein FJZ11_00605 [Candidatus Omnitrophica bacterium]|nr:hypothetical protein [Candidatus Omnitrophota bacterium]
MPQAQPVGYIVLGAVIALFSGFFTQVIILKWQDSRMLAMLKVLLSDAISQMNTVIDSIELIHSKLKTVYIEQLMQLRSARLNYDKNKDFIIRIKTIKLRKDITDYFDTMMIFDSVVFALLGMKNKGQFVEYADGEIKKQIDRLPGIKELGKSIIGDLDKLKTFLFCT